MWINYNFFKVTNKSVNEGSHLYMLLGMLNSNSGTEARTI